MTNNQVPNITRIMSIKSIQNECLALLILILISACNKEALGDQIESQVIRRQTNDRQSVNNSRTVQLRNFSTQAANLRTPTSSSLVQRSSSTSAANLIAVRQHWSQMEKSLGFSFDRFGDQFKLQLEELLSGASGVFNSSVSRECRFALAEVAYKIRDGSLWASQMIDASAKLPSGLLDGTFTEMGNFDGCLAIRSSDLPPIQGQYCTISIKPHMIARPRLHTACQRLPSFSVMSADRNNSLFRWISQNSQQFYYAGLRLGLCTPHQCNRKDLQVLLNHYVGKFDLIGQVKGCQVSFSTRNEMDYQLNQHFDSSQRIVIFALLVLVGLSFVGTLVDCLYSPKTKIEQTTNLRMQQHRQPRRGQYQVYQSDDKLNKCNECIHSASAHLAIWTSAGLKTSKEVPLLSCPATATTKQVELDYDDCFADYEEKDESWIVKLEQNQLQDDFREHHLKADHKVYLILFRLLKCFSLKQNLKTISSQVPSTSSSSSPSDHNANSTVQMEDIKVIHGLRTFTMIWIIFGHTIGLVNPEMMNNLFTLAQLSCSSRLLQALLNATLAVNTFFMISGVVTMISLVRRCQSAARLTIQNATIDKDIINNSKKLDKANRQPSLHRNVKQVNLDCTEDDSISIASSSQSSGVSSNLRCIHSNKLDQPELARGDTKTNFANFPSDFKPFLWLLMRYLRLTPAYATVIGLSILMPALGDGPFWLETAGQLGSSCKQNWHLNLAYLNNLLETDKLCLIHSWYLSNDWQFFLLTLSLLGLAYKSRKLALLVAISLGLASMAATFAVTVVNEFPPTIVTTSPAVAERWQFIHQLYYKPWPHLNSYLIGLLVGYFILKDSSNLSRPNAGSTNWRLICVAFVVTSLAGLLLSSIYPWNMGYRVDPIVTGIHSATFRTLWASCCGWLLYTLVRRPQLCLAKFLSWPGFQLTSRLTYCTYLIHPLVIYYHFGTLRERLDSSMYGQFSRFLATLSLSYLLAMVLSLLVESPSIQIQHLLSSLQSSAKGNSNQKSPLEKLRRRTTRRHMESSSSGSGTESAVTADSWLMESSTKHNIPQLTTVVGQQADLVQQQSSDLVPDFQLITDRALEPPPPPAATALDAEFQRKLAQAIGRGFKIRSRMAAGKASPASRSSGQARNCQRTPVTTQSIPKPPLQVEPTSMGLIQNPLNRLQTSQLDQNLPTTARRLQPAESLATFQPAQLTAVPGVRAKLDQVPPQSSSDQIARSGASDEQMESQVGNNNNCSLDDLIKMRRKYLSQRSHSSNVNTDRM